MDPSSHLRRVRLEEG
ncbi:hypothetical protein LINGRAHAP2_LOCUS19344 [Linum grandiflorum]